MVDADFLFSKKFLEFSIGIYDWRLAIIFDEISRSDLRVTLKSLFSIWIKSRKRCLFSLDSRVPCIKIT